MTASKLIPQAVAQQLLSDHPSTALDLALEIVRIVSAANVASARWRRDACELMSRREYGASGAITAAVCEHFSIDEKTVRSAKKTVTVSRARFYIWSLIRERLQWSYSEIGDLFGRDHTTVISGVANVDTDSDDYLAICQRLDAGAEATE